MPERTMSSKEYRYGFNGKEKDEDEEWGDLTHYDYGFRIYNPGIGRFLSVDPLSGEFPWYTPYQFAGNRPINSLDLDGLEELDFRILDKLEYGEIVIDMSRAPDVYEIGGQRHYTKIKGGRKWNPQYYFKEALDQAPDYWSSQNQKLILAGELPLPDETYLKKLGRNLSVDEFAELQKAANIPKTSKKIMTMEHHHLDQGNKAIGLPWKVHRGRGNTKFWHHAKKLGSKAFGIVSLGLSISELAKGNPVDIATGISTEHIMEDIENDLLDFALAQGFTTTMDFIRGNDAYMIYYATVDEILAMSEGEKFDFDGYRFISDVNSIEDSEFITGRITPYIVIFRDNMAVGIQEVPDQN